MTTVHSWFDVLPASRRPLPRPVPALVLGDLSLVRPVAEAGIDVHLGFYDAADVTHYSRLVSTGHLLPDPLDPAFGGALGRLGASLHQRYGRPVPLYYGTDPQLEAIYRDREALAAHFLFVLNEPETAWALHDKALFHELCTDRGVAVPFTLGPDDDLSRALETLEGPVVVKPRTKVAWKHLQKAILPGAAKARVYPDARALLADEAVRQHRHELIVQECIPADIRALCSFHGFSDENGTLLGSFCGRKIRTYPMQSGESACIELFEDREFEKTGREVTERLGLRGPFKIDMIQDARDGRWLTMEVNARFNLWHDLAAAHGVNLPGMAYEYLVHRKTPSGVRRPRPLARRWVSGYREFKAWHEVTQGSRPRGLWGWARSVLQPQTRYEVFAWNDPLPFAVWALRFAFGRLGRRASS